MIVDKFYNQHIIEPDRWALNHNSPAVTLIYALADMQLESKNRRRRAAAGRRKV